MGLFSSAIDRRAMKGLIGLIILRLMESIMADNRQCGKMPGISPGSPTRLDRVTRLDLDDCQADSLIASGIG